MEMEKMFEFLKPDFENIDDSFYRIREGKRTDLVDITEYFE